MVLCVSALAISWGVCHSSHSSLVVVTSYQGWLHPILSHPPPACHVYSILAQREAFSLARTPLCILSSLNRADEGKSWHADLSALRIQSPF
ncbi:hypothetical protein P154DRAFT_258942 [Amniculicola lignicola CBS 123094]|uniref:Secreted protein n=1 Tax=Amniculicola lignicola CBS 123094 TaxID=1392246 RepID=A0A6A5X231_9PLEO|nr:hypothetical protein P154DRAFT_258942 [Amniculicola lignicola CBS 123094]